MKLVAVRHLPTAWNEEGRLQGRRDIGLSEIDERLQSEIERNLATIKQYEPFDCVLASRLRRTQQTAFRYGYEHFAVEPLLDELDFGSYEGEKKSLLISELGAAWRDEPTSIVLGEPLVDFENRIVRFIAAYCGRKRVLTFCHGSWLRAMSSIARRGHIGEMNKLEIGNNALIVWELPA